MMARIISDSFLYGSSLRFEMSVSEIEGRRGCRKPIWDKGFVVSAVRVNQYPPVSSRKGLTLLDSVLDIIDARHLLLKASDLALILCLLLVDIIDYICDRHRFRSSRWRRSRGDQFIYPDPSMRVQDRRQCLWFRLPTTFSIFTTLLFCRSEYTSNLSKYTDGMYLIHGCNDVRIGITVLEQERSDIRLTVG